MSVNVIESVVSGRGARDAEGGTRWPVSGIADASVCESFARLFVALRESTALIGGMEESRDHRLVEASAPKERRTLDEIAPGTRTSPKPDAGTATARRLLSPEELASYLGVPRATVYRAGGTDGKGRAASGSAATFATVSRRSSGGSTSAKSIDRDCVARRSAAVFFPLQRPVRRRSTRKGVERCPALTGLRAVGRRDTALPTVGSDRRASPGSPTPSGSSSRWNIRSSRVRTSIHGRPRDAQDLRGAVAQDAGASRLNRRAGGDEPAPPCVSDPG